MNVGSIDPINQKINSKGSTWEFCNEKSEL